MRALEKRIRQLEKRNPDYDKGVLCLFTTAASGEEVFLATARPDGPPPETDLTMTGALRVTADPA